MANYKQLCAKVLAYHEGQGEYNFSDLGAIARDNAAFDAWQELIAELKSALAEPEPEGPTYDDLSDLCSQHGLDVDSWPLEKLDALWEIARAVLAHWGRPS